MTEDEPQSEMQDIENENRKLRDQLKELRYLEEDLMARRAFEKAKKYLFTWLTVSGLLLTLAALFGINSLSNHIVSLIEEKIKSISEEKISEILQIVSERHIAARFEAEREDINVLVRQHIQKVVVSLARSELRPEPVAANPSDSSLVAVVTSPSESTLEEKVNRFYDLSDIAKDAVRSGHLNTARELAKELLTLAHEFQTNWNYGNAIHDANVVLGLVALSHDDIESAEAHLLAAGKTPGSPQLDSFGPNMLLAEALLKRNETTAVLQYFELCGSFWDLDDGQLELWSAQVKMGEMPSFGANLRY